MRKINLFLFAALVFGLLANFTIVHAGERLDPEVKRVGLVVAYTPNQSITIVDKDGSQFTFTIAANLKIVPPHRADLLVPGAYVTIIAPNNVADGKWIATGIVIHPQAPTDFTATSTVVPGETETVTSSNSETPALTATVTETPTSAETATETVTPTPTAVETVVTNSLPQSNSQSVVASFILWLRTVFN
jgi:hypothetical protein